MGAVVGRAVTGSGTWWAGHKLSDYMTGANNQPSEEDLVKITKNIGPDIDMTPDVGGVIAGATTLAALSAMMANAAAGREWDAAHVPHMDVADYRAMMTWEQSQFLNDVIASQPGFRGALTVPGDPRGSFYGYWARMILTDLPRAERLLRPLIRTGDLAQELHGHERATQLIIDFYNSARPELFQNVGRLAALATSGYFAYKGAKKLWDMYKKWKAPKKKSQKRSYRPLKRRVRTNRSGNRKGNMKRDSLLKLFKRLDKDKSGYLTMKELKGLARRFKIKANELLKHFDTSNDGKVSWPEFARYMRKRLRQ